ncbi:MAG: glycosyltransferase family 39 protein [bacterium]|nr:glycosyltransferase family 39 protein [bacterium]
MPVLQTLRQAVGSRLKAFRFWRPEVWFAGVACAVAGVIMLTQLPAPYWFDEANTVYYVQQPWARMLAFVANDWFPPGYYFLLKAWTVAFGVGEIATGVLSLLTTIVAALLVYFFGRQLFDATVAFRATVLFWIAQSTIFFATETRMYALLVAAGVILTWLLSQIFRYPRSWSWYGWYVVAGIVGTYIHYPFWFFVFAHNVVWLLWRRQHRVEGSIIPWVAGQVAIVAAYVPQFVVLYDRVLHWYLAPSQRWLDNIPINFYIFWRMPFELLVWYVADVPVWISSAVITLVITALGLVFFQFRFSRRTLAIGLRVTDLRAAALAIIVLVPLTILWSLRAPVSRYVSYTLPFFCLLIFRGISHLTRHWAQQWFFVALIAAVMSANVFVVLTTKLHYQDAYWPVVHSVMRTIPPQPGTAIVAHYEDSVLLSYYYGGGLPMVRLPIPKESVEGIDLPLAYARRVGLHWINQESLHDLGAQLRGFDTVWYVRAGGAVHYDPDRLLDNALRQYCRVGEVFVIPHHPDWRYGTIELQRYHTCVFQPLDHIDVGLKR